MMRPLRDHAARLSSRSRHGGSSPRLDLEHSRTRPDRGPTDRVRAAVTLDLLHAIYERIIVAGRAIVAARLTPAAYASGLALALPQVVMARPEGFEPPTI
jgi:hypothetical protein